MIHISKRVFFLAAVCAIASCEPDPTAQEADGSLSEVTSPDGTSPPSDVASDTGQNSGDTIDDNDVTDSKFSCSECVVDEDCGKGRCISIKGGFMCADPCNDDNPCPKTFVCQNEVSPTGVLPGYCFPSNGTCDCTIETEGDVRPCTRTNEFGSCAGTETCDLADGWVGCDATTPLPEDCNGIDDDCDGETDNITTPPPLCTVNTPGVGTCAVPSVCSGQDGWTCNAPTPANEICDGLDNDCDGETDENFKKQGAYTHPLHCGACGNSCSDATIGGTATCEIVGDEPLCIIDECEANLIQVSLTECSPPGDILCAPCDSDQDCTGSATCTLVGSDTFCVLSCTVPGDCPGGFDCFDGHCVLPSGTCTAPGAMCSTDTQCDDLDECTIDACVASECTYSDVVCEDGDPCTIGEYCTGGGCLPALTLSCDDGINCTTDSCDMTGCVHQVDPDTCLIDGNCVDNNSAHPLFPCLTCSATDSATQWTSLTNGSTCDDSNNCTLGDTCQDGVCQSGATIDCDDQNPCTDDYCAFGFGCVHPPTANSTPCDDNDPCTAGDTCTFGQCSGQSSPGCTSGGSCVDTSECDDLLSCTTDTCETDTCSFTIEAGFCVINDACIPAGAASPNDPCAVCSPNSSTSTYTELPAGIECTDGSIPCDAATDCPPKACAEATCNATECTYIDLAGCVQGTPCNAITDCNDGLACTDDACTANVCTHTVSSGCLIGGNCVASGTSSPNNPCAACDPTQTTADWSDVASSCDDGNACTINDTCSAGVCVGGEATDCNDNNVCTQDYCDATSGCVYSPSGPLSCDDNNPCTNNEVCTAGSCLGISIPGCTLGNGCTSDNDCIDNINCTDDVCDNGQCISQVEPAYCLINGLCVQEGETSPSNACEVCAPSESVDTYSPLPAGVACSDGKVACSAATDCPEAACATASCGGGYCQYTPTADCSTGSNCANDTDCDDSLGCTDDSCITDTCAHVVTSGCLVAGACVSEGTQFECATCNSNLNPLALSPIANGSTCDDSNLCTIGDECANGTCVGSQPLDCNDDNVCTQDLCDPSFGCANAPVAGTLNCDDSNPCTSNDLCSGGACAGSNIPGCISGSGGCTNDIDCDDGFACTNDTCNNGVCASQLGGDACLINGSCQTAGSANPSNACEVCSPAVNATGWTALPPGIACSDGTVACATAADCPVKDCNTATCDTTGCAYTPSPGSCDDGDPCTIGDACSAGACVGDFASPCNQGPNCVDATTCGDNNLCTEDLCIAGNCFNLGTTATIGLSCDDGDSCTENSTCLNGTCNFGQAINCEDNNACTQDFCDSTAGCVHVPTTAACNDGNPCTNNDTCGGAACDGTPIPGCTVGPAGCTTNTDCNDNLACTNDTCLSGTCVFQLTNDTCLIAGACQNAGAFDSVDPCQQCQPSQSTNSWTTVANGNQCGDGNYACATASDCPTSTCQAATCINAVCAYTLAGSNTPCNDGNACTVGDLCDAGGLCSGTTAPICNTAGSCTNDSDCNDGSDCTEDSCVGGTCTFVGSNATNGLSCSDGDACTDNDICNAGTCSGSPSSGCQTGGTCSINSDCSDGLACTTDSCSNGTCTFQLTGGCLIGGACIAEDAFNSGNACEQCKPNGSLTSWTAVSAGAACGDGSIACPGFGACSPVQCQTALCTATGCVYSNSPGGESCNDGDPCTAGDTCSAGGCLGTPIDGCFANGACNTNADCNDGNGCTTSSCIGSVCITNVSNGCFIGGQCITSGATSGQGCLSCAPSTSKLTWTPAPNGTACNDGDSCTPTEACTNGACVGTSTTCNDGLTCTTDACDGLGGCTFTAIAGYCVINNACVAAGTANPTNACLVCDPNSNSSDWTPLASTCDDGDSCTFGDSCTTTGCIGTPYSCDDGLACTSETCDGGGGCNVTLLSGCLIGGACFNDGDVDPANPCAQCVTSNATDDWTSVPDNTPCDDGSICTTGDTCINGACQTTASCTASGFCSDCNSCACSSGTYGPDCAEVCPGGAATPCSNHGQCEGDGTCTCFDGFTGNDCSVMCSISGGAGSVDSDGDGVCDNDDPADNDGDGVLDASDNCPSGWNSADADSDGTPDACDTTPGGGTVVNVSQFNLCDSGSLTTTCVVSTSKSFNNQNLRISGPGSLTINNGATVSCSSSLCSLDIDMAQNVNLNGTIQAASVAVQGANIVVSGTVTTSGRGYSANNGPGAGSHCSTNIGASGAGHGGYGGGCNGNVSGGNKGMPYGNVKRSFEFGSGGGTQSAYGQSGGTGGGRIHLTATSQMTINGALSSAGNSGSGNSSSYGAGGGSGGSILIETPSLSGTGSLNAQGGNGAIVNGGGGAGGRISVLAANYGGGLNFSTGPGCSGASSGCSSSRAGAGTVYLQDSGTLIYDGNNGSASTVSPHMPGTYNHIEIREGANVEGTYPLNATQSLVLAGASALTAGAKPLMTSAPDTTIEGTISGNAVTVVSANTLSLGTSGTAACDSFDCTIGMYAQQQINIAGTVRASTIDLRGNSANVSGQVSAAGRGYAANNGPGAKGGCGTNIGAGGGSHAGAGLGCNAGLTDGSDVYGLPTRPWTYGSGGTTQSAYGQTGGAGGGRVRLSVEGVLNLTGSIDVKGTNGAGSSASYGAGGGAGGSVQVFAAEVTGTGLITADGGNGAIVNGGGGGGGRIAVYAQPSLPITTYARGGCGGASSGCSSTHAGAGTIYNGGSCTITVSNKGSGTSNPTPIAETVTVANLIVSSHGRAQIADALELQSSLTINANSLFSTTGANTVVNAPTTTVSGTINASENLQLNASNVTIAAGGNMKCSSNLCTLDVNSSGSWNVLGTVEGSFVDVSSASTSISGSITSEGRGYGPLQGPGSGQHCGTNIGASGASYGGRGGGCNSGTSGVKDHYGSIVEPADFGSGGGTQSAYGMTGGAGGGRIRVTSSGAMNITGSLSSAGKNGTGNSSSYGAGGGSGGTIQLIANSIGGTGTLNVRGGNGGIVNGGGGGGGRIEIDAQSGGDQLVLFTRGGCNAASSGCSSVYAGAGTVFYQDTKTLMVNSEGKTSRQTPWIAEDIANVVVESQGRLSGTGDMTAASSVLIKADGFLQNASSESITITTTALQVDGNITINSPGNLVSNAADSVSISGTVECAANRCETEFTTGSFTVAGTIRAGFINVTADSGTIDGLLNTDNRGYSPNQGPGAGAHCGSNIGASGGSHAGIGGGCNSSASSGVTLPYDDVFAPVDFGSGGGNQTAYGQNGGSGGGKIRLDVANSLTIDGTLSAVGGSGAGNSSSYGAGGGAGGSIYVTCNTVSGTGTLNVRGGNGGIVNAAGGAAGRIAIIPQNDNSNFTYELRGGCNAASSGCSSSYAGAGTYWDGLSQTLTVDAHGSSSLATPVVPVSIGNLVLLNKAKVTLAGDYSVSNTVSIGGGCQLESESSPASWTLNTTNFDVFGTFRLRSNAVLTANNINVPTGGLIDGVGLSELLVNTDNLTVAGTIAVSTTDIVTVTASIFGSIDSSSKGNPANQGTGSGGSCGTNVGASGGGYGGTGGGCNTGNTAYGDPKQPFEVGSGGGTQSAYGQTGGAGAGRVRIVASGDIDISGSVLAIGGNGNGNSSTYGAGGGSGGAIWLDAPSILGTGSVLARGGNGGIVNGGGGSGGRIALYYTDQLSLGLTIRAQGGCKAASSGCSSVKAGGGTIYDSLLDQVTADQ